MLIGTNHAVKIARELQVMLDDKPETIPTLHLFRIGHWQSTELEWWRDTSDRILTATDQKKTSAVVLLDMSKAFDSVNHDILLKKLQDIGLSPSAILWFKSYLSNRYQAVLINTALSKPLLMRYGVPQGSILGPLLFTAYTNDLSSIPQHCSTDCYVYDTKLLMSFRVQDCEPTMAAMNDDLIKLRNWCFNNRLLLNPDKTKLEVGKWYRNFRIFALPSWVKNFYPSTLLRTWV